MWLSVGRDAATRLRAHGLRRLSSLLRVPRAEHRRPTPVDRRTGTRALSDCGERPGVHQNPIVDTLWQRREGAVDDHDAVPLVPRPPSFSQLSVDYRFGSDATLREHYLNPWGKVRIGRVFEDLDALAGSIALEHCKTADGKLPPKFVALVTASVERICARREFESVDSDMVLQGRVTYVGSSSINVAMTAQCAGFAVPWINASFMFVARDTRPGGGAWRVNPLQLGESSAVVARCRWLLVRARNRRCVARATPGTVSGGAGVYQQSRYERLGAPCDLPLLVRCVTYCFWCGVRPGVSGAVCDLLLRLFASQTQSPSAQHLTWRRPRHAVDVRSPRR